MNKMPSFHGFFEALWQREPFPWQVRLAAEVTDRGWPDLLDLPTSSGKTSALDVAIYCLAAAPLRLPRRTVLVVDRRIVVDQAAERARHILHAMRDVSTGPVKVVADRLRALWNASAEDDAFAIALMRGGMPRDNDWAKRPDQPVLGVSTVDQVGSRLLFRGYGVGPRSASIHAGLLGNDTLILLDEVHLAVPFTQTLAVIRERYQRKVDGLPQRFGVVRMSATAGPVEPAWRVFGLDDADRAHLVLAARLTASKRAELVPLRVTGDDEAEKRAVVAECVVKKALDLQKRGATVVGVVVNRVDTARLAYRLLRGSHEKGDDEVILVTGRMRAIDRDALVRETLLKRVGPRSDREPNEKPLVVVATQCIEAGADLDFDGLVTECASLDALRQRFGRLDRQGQRKQSAAIIVGRSDATGEGADDPIYGPALAATWRYLIDTAHAGFVDFGISAMPTPLSEDGSPRTDVLAPVSDAPVLLPAHVEAWAQTSPSPAFDPDIALWLHGPARLSADVQVVWRSDVTLPTDPGDPSADVAIERLSARRPSSLESITVPLGAARRWLAGDSPVAIADVSVGDIENSDPPRRKREEPRNEPIVALRWSGDSSSFVKASAIKAGDVLVVPISKGGISAGSFDPDAKDEVVDVGDLAQLRGRGIASLLVNPASLTMWGLGEAGSSVPGPLPDESAPETRDRIAEWMERWPARPQQCPCTEREWKVLTTSFSSTKGYRVSVRDDDLLLTKPLKRRDLLGGAEVSESLSEDDDSSFRQVEVRLRDHSAHVRDFAEKFAASIGFAPVIVRAIAVAGWLHDVGKADPRFQRWLVGGSEVRAALLDEPLAKSALPAGSSAQRRLARKRAGYPDGYRHELLSLAMVEDARSLLDGEPERDLILHLISSHHGWCRPFAPAADHPDDFEISLDHGGALLRATTRHQRARLDSGVGDRFWRLVDKYGCWGLAWLEAVMRLADHRASETEAEQAT